MAIQQTKTYLLIFFSFIYSITSLYADYIDYADYARDPLMLIPKPQSIKIQNATHLFEDTINNNKITIQYVSSIPQALVNQKEAYHLTITPDSIFIKATADQGIYWAKQTLSQLITQFRNKHYLPCCEIIDWPAFHIRGFMHDVGRSYISPDELKKEIAILSTYKINTFHWHLTEDLGWRLESKIYPQLNDSANFGRLPGKYYTIDEAKDIAEFCKAYHVLLIPEIDMPGHSAAFRKAFGCDMQSPEGMDILKQLLKEICIEIFPDLPYLHIGTDEVEITKPEFVPEMVQHIRSMGKKVISWNPGYAYHPGEIDMIHMWSSRGKPLVNTPTIDSRYHYINHFDNFADLIALYNSNIGNREYEKDLPPPQGEWDYRKSKIMINDKEIQPPVWSNNHTILSSEIPLGNENFAMRPPIPVTLKKGWNKILLKLPIGEFSTKEVRLQKWMFTFVFVTLDGKEEVEGLIYNPDKKIDKENEKQ